jgi:hypothetical protein
MSMSLKRGADDVPAVFVQVFGEFERRLAAELHDHTVGFFMLQYLLQMLPVHRLEVEFVGNVKVGAHRFGVAVHHNGLVTNFFGRQHAVYAAVVELDALPDAVGAGTEHHDFFLVGYDAFAGANVGEVSNLTDVSLFAVPNVGGVSNPADVSKVE